MHIITQGVAFDPGKAAANWRKHGVSFAHAEQALRDQRSATMEDPDAEDEARFVTLGMDAAGEYWWWYGRRAGNSPASFPQERPARARWMDMRDEYDFSRAQRGAVIASPGKTRITIMIDDDVIEAFRARAEAEGCGYQTAINAALRAALDADNAPVTVAVLRRELRKALKSAA